MASTVKRKPAGRRRRTTAAKRRRSVAQLYFEQVLSGEVTACRKVRRLAQIMAPRFERGAYKGWHFDIDKSERPVKFIETFCKMPSGRTGEPIRLEPYQRAVVETVFGWVDKDGYREFQEVLNIWGRKNGKTTLLAALELYMLCADGEGSPQIYNVASSKPQASLGYGAAVKMWKQSPALSKHVRKGTVVERDSDGLIFDRNMGYITPLSSATRHLDGLDTHFAVIDELSSIVNRDLYDLVKQSTPSRRQPMIFTISTSGFTRGGIFDDQMEYAEKWLKNPSMDDRFIPFIYELDSKEEWTDESCWVKANPGLGTVKSVDALRGYVEKAKNDPAFLPTVLCKDFNVPANQASAWLTYDEAVNEEPLDLDGCKYAVVGFDASDTTDLTAAKALMLKALRDEDGNVVRDENGVPVDDGKIYELSMYWIPEDTIRQWSEAGSRNSRDNAPYEKWIERGLMRTVPGNKIPKRVIVDWILELRDQGILTFACGYDPWHIDDTTEEQLKRLIGSTRVHKVVQGPKTLSGPMKQMKPDFAAGRFVDGHNPVNEWCRMNAECKVDVNDNWQLEKKLRDPRNRIDGLAAELDAYTVMIGMEDDLRRMLK